LGSPQKRNEATASPAYRAPRPGARRSSGPSRSCCPGSTYGSNSDRRPPAELRTGCRKNAHLPAGKGVGAGNVIDGLDDGQDRPFCCRRGARDVYADHDGGGLSRARRHAKRQRLRLSQLSSERLTAAASAAAAAAAAVVAAASGARRAQERNACPVSKA
jgi:hypothetical protein